MRTFASICVTIAMLTACSTPARRAAEKVAEAEQMMMMYGPPCERLGYVANTDPWRSCVVQMNQTDALRYSYGYTYPFRNYGGPYF
jgi:hypothetical protein